MEDYGTPELEGCPEILNETRPDLIAQMHREYLEAGADVVETNSFGGMRATLGEYGLGERTEELNEMAARIARGVADEFSTPGPAAVRRRIDRPRHPLRLARPRPLRGAARPGRRAGPWAAARRRRPAAARDPVRPAGHQGRHERLPRRHGRRRPGGPDPDPGHHRADRAHAARHRDRRGARRARRDAARRDRHQLRDRPRGDERAHPAPVGALAHPDLGAAQRRAALGGRRPHALRPDRRAVRRLPPPLHHRVRRQRRRRLLRHHPGVHPPARRGRRRGGARAARPPLRARRRVDLLAGAARGRRRPAVRRT